MSLPSSIAALLISWMGRRFHALRALLLDPSCRKARADSDGRGRLSDPIRRANRPDVCPVLGPHLSWRTLPLRKRSVPHFVKPSWIDLLVVILSSDLPVTIVETRHR